MTITELREALIVLEDEGHGNATVVLAADAEGNTFKNLAEIARGNFPARRAYGIEFRCSNQQVNAVCLWPE